MSKQVNRINNMFYLSLLCSVNQKKQNLIYQFEK
jgi:hypothetical protein